jgi:transposase InsO family protein
MGPRRACQVARRHDGENEGAGLRSRRASTNRMFRHTRLARPDHHARGEVTKSTMKPKLCRAEYLRLGITNRDQTVASPNVDHSVHGGRLGQFEAHHGPVGPFSQHNVDQADDCVTGGTSQRDHRLVVGAALPRRRGDRLRRRRGPGPRLLARPAHPRHRQCSQFTSRDFRRHLSARSVAHRRGGYRDPESQAFIESWFGQFKKRLAWRSEWESLDQARKEIATYIDRYHRRPHSGLAYRTPAELATIWRPDPDVLQTPAT